MEGVVQRGAHVRLLRNDVVIHEGKLAQLKRLKDDAKEVTAGYECGMSFQNYQDMRVGDFIELGELMCRDALHREESCGGHFREEYQYTAADPEVQQGLVNPGDVKRRDDQFAYVAAWEFAGDGRAPVLNREPLVYEEVKMSTRSYK